MPEVIKQISAPIISWKTYMKIDNKRLAAKALNHSISIKQQAGYDYRKFIMW